MLLLALSIMVASVASTQHTECKTCIRVDNLCHNVSFMFNLEAPFRNTIVIDKMGILRPKNLLYFAFQPDINNPEYYEVAYVSLNDKNVKGIVSSNKPVNNFKVFDIDQTKELIYLGGSDGVYTLENNGKAAFFSSGSDMIESIFFKNNVYFVRAGENVIVEKKGENFRPFEEYKRVKNFVIDKNNILVFLNSTGLYATKFLHNNAVALSKNAFLRGLALDLDGKIYAWWIDGIYRVNIERDLEDSQLLKVADVNAIGALTFDNNNNILFTSRDNLFKLTPTNATVVC